MHKSYIIWLDEEDKNEFVLNGKLFVGIVDGTIELQPPEIRSYWFSSLLSGKDIMDDVATGFVSLPAEKSIVWCVWKLVELPSRKEVSCSRNIGSESKMLYYFVACGDWLSCFAPNGCLATLSFIAF
jgi:hypothetical protein